MPGTAPDGGSPVQVLLRGVLGGRKGGRKQKTRPHGAEEKPYGRACYLSPKARHTVGTHTGTKPNSRHLPQVTASKPSSGQPTAGSGTN